MGRYMCLKNDKTAFALYTAKAVLLFNCRLIFTLKNPFLHRNEIV